MTRTLLAAVAVTVAATSFHALAQDKAPKPSAATIEAYLKSTFGKAPPEWQARIEPDETLAVCNATRNNVSSAQIDEIIKREIAKVKLPASGKFVGDWKAGVKVANNGRGGQFSDPPGTEAGGNCFACHQLDPKEVSYGTLGPSLKAYGKDRKFDPEEAKNAYIKIYDSHAVVPCSNMPRFGTNNVLSEQQIVDVVGYLFDPESPVNK